MTVLLRRLGLLLLVIWAAATINFFLPRCSGRDPIREKLGELAASGGIRQDGIEEMVKAYQAKFGFDRPLWVQYGHKLLDTFRMDFGVSFGSYPSRVSDLIGRAIPWTLGLLLTTTVASFGLGCLLGAAAAWPAAPRVFRWMAGPFMALSAVPFYLLGLILVYVFGLILGLFPISGGSSPRMLTASGWPFAKDVLRHSVLPALSLVLAAVGFWALGMRGMMVGTVGEDYIALAEANGLRPQTIFFRYAMRNAILPQYTALALSLGYVVSGQVAVEVVFNYPGIGALLFRAIVSSDYNLINGIVFLTILSIGVITVALDLSYPLLDPRIRHRGDAP